jgi:hypothetical protein
LQVAKCIFEQFGTPDLLATVHLTRASDNENTDPQVLISPHYKFYMPSKLKTAIESFANTGKSVTYCLRQLIYGLIPHEELCISNKLVLSKKPITNAMEGKIKKFIFDTL